MTKAIQVQETGGAEVLRLQDVDVKDPSSGEAKLRQTAIGLNFIDVYFRDGSYPAPELPFTPGMEAAGVVEALGSDVSDLAVGDRVVYASPPMGAYAEERLMVADRLVKIPEGIDDRSAAAAMLKGMTAQYLLRQTADVKSGDTILFHAGAGGVGLIACQWAHHLGATVIATVGSEEKAELVRAHGCDHAILYKQEDFVARVDDLTGGKGVDVVYDAVGLDTLSRGFECLRPRGLMVLFGASSGKPEPVDPPVLQAGGSLFLTRPSLFDYVPDRESLLACAADLFDVIQKGAVEVKVNQEWALADAPQAHRALEARETTGSTLLIPG